MDVVIEDHVRLLNNIIHFSTPNDEVCASTQPATVTVAEGVVLETTIDPLTKQHLLACDIWSGLPLPHSDISLKGKYDKDDGLWEDIGHGER